MIPYKVAAAGSAVGRDMKKPQRLVGLGLLWGIGSLNSTEVKSLTRSSIIVCILSLICRIKFDSVA